MNMHLGIITGVNANNSVNIACDSGLRYNNVRLLGQTVGNTSGFINVAVVGQPIVAMVDNGLVFACPISVSSDAGDMPGDTGMYDQVSNSSVKVLRGKGVEIKAGRALSIFLSSLKGAFIGLFKKIAVATNLYRVAIKDTKDEHSGKVDIYDKDYNKTASLTFGEDGELDNEAKLAINISTNGDIELTEGEDLDLNISNDGGIELTEGDDLDLNISNDGDYTLDLKKYVVKNDNNTITMDDNYKVSHGSTSNMELTESKAEIKGGNEMIKLDGSGAKIEISSNGTVTINGQVMIKLNGGKNIEISQAMIKMAGGTQFIALAIPFLQLLVTHTHIDPLSGTTGTAILTGSPTDAVSKNVMAD